MTSRRSRLKAVTNLPVRRKVPTVQENTIDTISVDNLTSEKVFSDNSNSDEILASSFNSSVNHVVEKDIYEISNKDPKNGSFTKLNCSDYQKNENFVNENDISKNRETDNLEVLENSNDLNKTCCLLSCKADSNDSSLFKNDYICNLDSVSSASHDGEAQLQILENKEGNEFLTQQNCAINYSSGTNNNRKNSNNNISNNNNNNSNNNNNNSNNNNNNSNNNNNNNSNNNNNNNNNIVEEGFKCYTILTSQNVALNSLTEYTIAPLVSCTNNYINSSVDDVNSIQEFEEVQIYTELEPTELYINSEIDNSESIIETEPLEPVLTNLIAYNSEQEVDCSNSSVVEVKNNSENLLVKHNKKFSNAKTNFSESEQHKSLHTQSKDSSVLKKVVSSGTQKVSPDFHSFKQMSTVKRKRIKYNDYTKKLADAKREFQRKYEKSKPDRSTLKMIDLIFYNPSSNPMESKARFVKKNTLDACGKLMNELIMEEEVDEPDILDCDSRSKVSDNGESESIRNPVPQVKIGIDGEIILDEKSLLIETTDAKKGREGLQNSVPMEDKECKVSYYRGNCKKTRDWADFETKRFYKALNTIGPDFTLMQKYFPKRSRLELKNKFKREERLNRTLIDKALNNPSEFDMTQLEKDLAVEKAAEEGREMKFGKIIRRTARRSKNKSSLLSREMIESDEEPEKNQLKSFDVDSKILSEKEKNKKEKEYDFIFQKLLMKESEKSGVVLPDILSSPNALKDSNRDVT